MTEVKEYPWLRRPTDEETAEGQKLFKEGWRGVSNRHRMIALYDRIAYLEWLQDELDNWSAYQYYLRVKAPTQTVAFHIYREIKRQEKVQSRYV